MHLGFLHLGRGPALSWVPWPVSVRAHYCFEVSYDVEGLVLAEGLTVSIGFFLLLGAGRGGGTESH